MPEIVTPNSDSVQKENAVIVEQAKGLSVATVEEHALGLEMYQYLSRREKLVQELFADAKKKAHEAHKAITAMERKLLDPLGAAKLIVAGKCQAFKKKQEEEARKREAELAAKAREAEEDRLLAEAMAAEAQGDAEGAKAILEEEVAAPMVKVEAKVATLAGVGTQKRWRCVIEDLLALVQWVAANPSKIELLEPERLIESHPNLNNLARTLRKGFSIPGCKAVEEEGLTSRG